MGVRATMLELAILGELDEPLHGYEVRRRLSAAMGPFRTLSYGSLYPALHRLRNQGLISKVEPPAGTVRTSRAPRRQVAYQLTDPGRHHLAKHLPSASTDDESLALTMRLMSKASAATRLELLKQRRADVLKRRDANSKASLSKDAWVSSRAVLETKQNDHELAWLNQQIALTTDDSSADRPNDS